ncbi:MAG: dipeptide/oligopeptide/nickel ABC transporter permease/ATP-binding protein [Leucobacter sp.]
MDTSGTRSPRRRRFVVLRRVLKNPLGLAAVCVLLLELALGLLAPVIAPHGPNELALELTNAPPWGEYLFGGDGSGRDIYSRLLYGIMPSLTAAFLSAGVAALIGIPTGLIAGFYGGSLGSTLTWIFGLIQAFPTIIFLIALYTVTGSSTNLVMMAFGAMLSVTFFRLVRDLASGVRKALYVDAARVSGLSDPRIIFRHVLSVVRAPVIVAAAFVAGMGVTVQAGLSFIGLTSATDANWGTMLSDAFAQFAINPTAILWPAAAIGITVASFVFLGNAVRDASSATRDGERSRGSARIALVEAEADPAAPETTTDALLTVRGLRIEYEGRDGGDPVRVVDGVDLSVRSGEVLGLVGQSGSGKTQTAFAVLGLLPSNARIAGGSIRMDGVEFIGLDHRRREAYLGAELGYIPQEPMSSLYPLATVGSQLVHGVRSRARMSRVEAKARVLELLDRVGIPDPERMFRLYPHEISGGMAQRALIAGAVASAPRLLIADEPTTALDVTVQAEILDLLRDLQRERGMAVILVTHNLGVVADSCDRVAVMRKGTIVEVGGVREVLASPQHEYTQELLGSLLDEQRTRAPLNAGTETP